MFNATEFTYDGIYSEQYGLKIASFNSNVLEETPYVVPSVITAIAPKAKKYHFIDITYDSPPTYDFSVVSEVAIHEELLREILLWLDSRKGFKPLTIMQQGLDEFTYNCIFTVTSLIYHSGDCVGLNLSATFDSRYVTGKPIESIVFGNGGVQDIYIYNDSDNLDEYIYPMVEFDTANGAISIVNMTDDKTREFAFEGLSPNSIYKVDNELKIIAGSGNDLLTKFSKKWLRILRGKNHLRVRVNGTATITCPRYIKIRF